MTVRVFSSTKLSVAQSRSISVSRLTTLPFWLHERLENPVFVFGQIDALAVIGEDGIGGVQNGIPVFQERDLSAEVIGAPQQRLDLRQQDIPVKGLRDEIVTAHVHCHDEVHVVRCGREKDDGNFGDTAYLPAPVVAVVAGQHNVHQNQMGIECGEFAQNATKILHHTNLKVPLFQLVLKSLCNAAVILHQKNAVCHGNTLLFSVVVCNLLYHDSGGLARRQVFSCFLAKFVV